VNTKVGPEICVYKFEANRPSWDKSVMLGLRRIKYFIRRVNGILCTRFCDTEVRNMESPCGCESGTVIDAIRGGISGCVND
jgi:hypothetical protein